MGTAAPACNEEDAAGNFVRQLGVGQRAVIVTRLCVGLGHNCVVGQTAGIGVDDSAVDVSVNICVADGGVDESAGCASIVEGSMLVGGLQETPATSTSAISSVPFS